LQLLFLRLHIGFEYKARLVKGCFYENIEKMEANAHCGIACFSNVGADYCFCAVRSGGASTA